MESVISAPGNKYDSYKITTELNFDEFLTFLEMHPLKRKVAGTGLDNEAKEEAWPAHVALQLVSAGGWSSEGS